MDRSMWSSGPISCSVVQFKDLSLLIVDEEQRFGVRHKERIKKALPRGQRPDDDGDAHPENVRARHAWRATGSARSRRLLRRRRCAGRDRLSLRRADGPRGDPEEFERGGQVFFLHNRPRPRRGLRSPAGDHPGRVGVAHGQMNPADADAAMIVFIRGQTNLLVCTTIIESTSTSPTPTPSSSIAQTALA